MMKSFGRLVRKQQVLTAVSRFGGAQEEILQQVDAGANQFREGKSPAQSDASAPGAANENEPWK